MAATSSILAWTLLSEIPIPDDVNDLLVEGEEAVAAYKTFRDSAVFTTDYAERSHFQMGDECTRNQKLNLKTKLNNTKLIIA